MPPPKFIFVTGGVVSSLGKGIAAASLGALLQDRGFRVRCRKLDPYLNVDAGTMNPYQHGEVFVTADGAETDLDLGHYERFTGVEATKADSITAGQIYQTVIANERRGDYLGATVQVIPHVTDEIKRRIAAGLTGEDFVIVEIGGSVGDIEGLPFIEAVRQLANDLCRDRVLFVHLALLPWIESAQELKTKPAQHSVRTLLGLGIQASILLCRTDRALPEEARRKLALFCNVKPEAVIEAIDVPSVYDVPLSLEKAGFAGQVLHHFDLMAFQAEDPDVWIRKQPCAVEGSVNVAVVGKYTGHADAYRSLGEALKHAGWALNLAVNVRWIDAEDEDGGVRDAEAADAIIVPGGFGARGTEGMLTAIEYARESDIPFLGICFGMQLAVIEALINVGDMFDAGSTELDPDPGFKAVDLWHSDPGRDLGGTMSLGELRTVTETGLGYPSAGDNPVLERYRHRYHLTRLIGVDMLMRSRLVWTQTVTEGHAKGSCAAVERIGHPQHFFVGVQYHPEFRSRPGRPHPLFIGLLKAAVAYRDRGFDGQV